MGQTSSSLAIQAQQAPQHDKPEACGLCSSCTMHTASEVQLFVCDGCGLEVCENCVGRRASPENAQCDWFCCLCAFNLKAETVKCRLCPLPPGQSNLAMGPTESGHFAHIACYNWLQEAHIKDSLVNTFSSSGKCFLCNDRTEKTTRLLECCSTGCKQRFHVPCMVRLRKLHNRCTAFHQHAHFAVYNMQLSMIA
jgi:hypothetical protein